MPQSQRLGTLSQGEAGGSIAVKMLSPGGRGRLEAIHRALDLSPPALAVSDLLAAARRDAISLDLLCGAYVGRTLVSACLAVEQPGSTAMLFFPPMDRPGGSFEGTVAAVEGITAAAADRPIALLEVLTPPGDRSRARTLRGTGFRHLTGLRYLRRPVDERGAHDRTAVDLEWVDYSDRDRGLFEEALRRTYVGSADCPELTPFRTTDQVLEGHRGAGVFDPALWWVALRGGEPVGVMLLNRISPEPAVEVEYMGVAPLARGGGVSDALLGRALRRAGQLGARTMSLSVDERNRPARRLYRRWEFVETGARDAWILNPAQVRG